MPLINWFTGASWDERWPPIAKLFRAYRKGR